MKCSANLSYWGPKVNSRNWVSLSSIAAPKGLVGGPFGSNLGGRDYVDAGVPVIRGQNLALGRVVDFNDCVYVSDEKVRRDLARNLAIPGDLVFTQRGTLGQLAMMPDDSYDHAVVSQSQMRLRVDSEIASPEYVYFACSSPDFVREIQTNAIISGVPHINLGILGQIEIPFPPLDEQRRIAGVLGVLDSLIDTNEQIVESVRELSSSAYRRAKSRSTESIRLGDVVEVNLRKTRKKDEGFFTYLDIASLGDGVINWPDPSAWASAPSRARRLAEPGATLWSTVRPNRRAHALLINAPEDLVISTGLAVLTPKQIGPAELFAATDEQEFTDYLVKRSEGSAYPAVRGDAFENAQIARLSAEESKRFEGELWPLWQMVGALENENRDLVSARDNLLPLLMSGKIRVFPDDASKDDSQEGAA